MYESGADNEISGKYGQGKIVLDEYGTFVHDPDFIFSLPQEQDS